jgi:hypothetical protein
MHILIPSFPISQEYEPSKSNSKAPAYPVLMKANMTRDEPIVEWFRFRFSLVPHLVNPKISTKRMAKNKKRISHRPSSDIMTGKLALSRKFSQGNGCLTSHSHRSFKELVQIVCSLDQLEGDEDKEQLLKLLEDKVT